MPSATLDQSLFDSIPEAISAFRNGEMLVVLDDPSRENEADLILAAEDSTPENMAFMVRHTSGFICAPILPNRADRLALPLMVERSEDPRGTAYTVSVDAADPSLTTGISAYDRALTCRTLATPASDAASLRRPGHVLPLRARSGGVRERRGHTEAAIDLCRLAGKEPAAVICEVVDDGGEVPGRALRTEPGMLRGEQCITFARRFGLKVITIADMVDYLHKTDDGGAAKSTAATKAVANGEATENGVPV